MAVVGYMCAGGISRFLCVCGFLGVGWGASTKHWPVEKRESSCVV